ncbi:unknown [Salmonella phage FelixO1]|uniref:Uncharacterized protein n=1 Tax=Salmonella phage Felix O1 (isolate Felix O1-VT1) TaxID=1283336 RepID=Q6KGD1_BPFO1|nr:unknown [Salmonella phage FelixO1]
MNITSNIKLMNDALNSVSPTINANQLTFSWDDWITLSYGCSGVNNIITVDIVY